MNFIKFRTELQENFKKLSKNAKFAYQVNLDTDELWNVYQESFPNGTNELFRKKRSHDCSCCKHFMRQVGNLVFIENLQIKTIWDFKASDKNYQFVADKLAAYVKSFAINNVFLSRECSIGTESNYERAEKVIKWDHFYLDLPEILIEKTKPIEELKGEYRTCRNTLESSLSTITINALEDTIDLINENNLYRGAEFKNQLLEFLKIKKEFKKVKKEDLNTFLWYSSTTAGPVVSKIKNSAIGTLLLDLSNGVEMEKALKSYETKVAGPNYKRPKAIFTKKMMEDAKKIIKELGYTDSLKRRFAVANDISINNVLFADRTVAKSMKDSDFLDDLFDSMNDQATKKITGYKNAKEISIEDFINNVLPTAVSIEAYVENSHEANFMSLIAPENRDSKTMFKWNNNFCWSYKGNITDSDIKSRVKLAGGDVTGVLRFSIQWHDLDNDNNDLDAHCIEPNGNEIYYGKPKNPSTTGKLDIDIVNPRTQLNKGEPAVENITWENISKMKKGTYKFFVNNFSDRGGTSGFRAEIEFEGQIYKFNYKNKLRNNENVQVAEVYFDGNKFIIDKKIPSEQQTTKSIWGVDTKTFVPVSMIMYSPNYWDKQKGIGNKHYMFILKDCINDETPNAFFNEYLEDSLKRHKKVFEALGSNLKVSNSDDQLSGLGFSSTIRKELIVKVKSDKDTIYKVMI